MANELASFLNSGKSSHLDRMLLGAAASIHRPTIIDFMDLSSSIGHGRIPEFIVRAQQQYLAPFKQQPPGRADVWQFGVSSDITLLHPSASGPVDLNQIRLFSQEDLSDRGLLGAGSRLPDALYLGARLALALRRAGNNQNIGLSLITDGWSRNGAIPGNQVHVETESESHAAWRVCSQLAAREALNDFRREGGKIKVLGFVDSGGKALFEEFEKAVGLSKQEALVIFCESRRADEARSAVDRMMYSHRSFASDISGIKS